MERNRTTTKFLVESGVMIAVATVLSYFTILQMPQGGTVTPGSMVPILIIGLRYGVKKGIITGVVYGLLQAILQGSIIHPIQFFLDYPIAFGALGLSGIFATKVNDFSKSATSKYPYILSGVIIAVMGRFICHVLSGAIFFKEYAGAQNPWIYSIIYNSTYLIAEMILSAVILSLIWTALDKNIFRKI